MTDWLLSHTADGRALRIRAGRVVEHANGLSPGDAAVLDCHGGSVEPGRVNAHTHLYSGLAPLGMPAPRLAPENFVQILERIWWRLDRALDAQSLRAAARLYIANALLAGTTTLVDHHESPHFVAGSLDVLADACAELGCRALLTFGATERNGGQAEGQAGLAECRRFIEHNTRTELRGLIGLHASFTVSDATIMTAARLCQELSAPMHVHVAEDLADVDDARRRGYRDPLDRLLRLSALPPGSIVAHGVHLDEAAVRRCADEGLWLVQNPRSNHGNRVGYPRCLRYSSRVALGTDGYPAVMSDEEAALTLYAREAGDDASCAAERPNAGWSLLRQHFALPFAPLEVGSAADLVVRDGQGAVRHVFVAGRLVVRDGALAGADLLAIRREAEAEAQRLWQLMATIDP